MALGVPKKLTHNNMIIPPQKKFVWPLKRRGFGSHKANQQFCSVPNLYILFLEQYDEQPKRKQSDHGQCH